MAGNGGDAAAGAAISRAISLLAHRWRMSDGRTVGGRTRGLSVLPDPSLISEFRPPCAPRDPNQHDSLVIGMTAW